MPRRDISKRLVPFKLGHLPGCRDRRWFGWTRPLREFLKTHRSWRDLKAWSKENDVNLCITRHLIAWLEAHREIEFNTTSLTWHIKKRAWEDANLEIRHDDHVHNIL